MITLTRTVGEPREHVRRIGLYAGAISTRRRIGGLTVEGFSDYKTGRLLKAEDETIAWLG